VTRWLVQHDFAVHAIAGEEQTLEDFYLSLMGDARGVAQKGGLA
jgi:hypothetical protein